MKTKIVVGLLALSMTGCAFFTNKAKRGVLQEADKELDGLIEAQKSDCDLMATRLGTLKQKVLQELAKVK